MARKITVAGGNLFQIAALTLGDATQANRLAVLNGLLDPFAIGVSTLSVPEINKSATGGLPFGPILGEAWPWAPSGPPPAAPPPIIQPVAPPEPLPDQPPITEGPWLWSVLTAHLPVPPLPTLTQQLPPSLMAVTVSAPVTRQRAWTDPVTRSWQPPDPPPTLPQTLPPPLLAVSVNAPIPGSQIDAQFQVLRSWIPPDPLPNLGTNLNPLLLDVPVNPEIDNNPWSIDFSSDFGPTLSIQTVTGPGSVIARIMSMVNVSWQPLPPLPTLRNTLPSSFTANRPIPKRDRWLPDVLASWQPQKDYFYRH